MLNDVLIFVKFKNLFSTVITENPLPLGDSGFILMFSRSHELFFGNFTATFFDFSIKSLLLTNNIRLNNDCRTQMNAAPPPKRPGKSN